MNDINLLMSRIDEINRTPNPRDLTDTDITTLILYYRRLRAKRAAGEKPDRPSRPSIDISTILDLSPSKPALPPISRRL